ncbi:hypothetical protein IL306_002772 [Fusarium sp. DS 682]|nr:hypothetical protein IL306_002772 [Fusarium sp. DS 682]
MLALALRKGAKYEHEQNPFTYIDRARPYMDIICQKGRSNGLLVVLAPALFYMTTPDLGSASILVATAVKFVHRLKIHELDGASGTFDKRLVWITYIIDRDLSLRTGEPYLMQEHDIAQRIRNIARNPLHFLDESDTDDPPQFNIFKFRAELAAIQGKIYDLVYSIRASKLSVEQQETVAHRLDDMLKEWDDSISESFKGDKVPEFNQVQMRFFKQLRVTYYHCIFLARKATLDNWKWVKRLLSFGQAGEKDYAETPLLPGNWPDLVKAARSCLDILSTIDSRDVTFGCDRWKQDPTGFAFKSFENCGQLIIKARESVQKYNEANNVEQA